MEKSKSFSITVVVNESREKVWDTLYTRFGETFLYNPNIDGSHFVTGSTGEVGCERVCNMDSKTFVREKIVKATTQKSFTVDIVGGNMPMVKELKVSFELSSLKSNQTKVDLLAEYKTKPAFMAGLAKGMFRKKLADVLIGLKYHVETGRAVSKQTYKPIAKQYKKLELNQSFS